MEASIRHFINEEMRPLVQADGGEMLFQRLDGDSVYVSVEGNCAVCAISTCGLKEWIEERMELRFGKSFKLVQTINKRYFGA